MSYLDQLAELRRQEKEIQMKIKEIMELAIAEALELSAKEGKWKFRNGNYTVLIRQKPYIPNDVEALQELEMKIKNERDKLMEKNIEQYLLIEEQKKNLAQQLEELVSNQDSLLENETVQKLVKELETLREQLTEYKLELAIQLHQ